MRNFEYVARDLSGQSHSGLSQATNKNDVLVALRNKGLVPVEIHDADVARKSGLVLVRKRKIKSIELASFCWQLQAMLEGGVSITSAIETIHDDCENPYFQQIMKTIGESLEQGEPLSSGVAHFPKVFGKIFCSMILAGETGGAMPAALGRLADYYDNRDKLSRKIKGALAYPVFIVGFVVFLVVFIMTFIIPRFKSIFDEIGTELPAITRAFMFGYDGFVTHLPHIVVCCIAAVITLIFYAKTENGWAFFSKVFP